MVTLPQRLSHSDPEGAVGRRLVVFRGERRPLSSTYTEKE